MISPLAERVNASADLAIPADSPGLSWRHARLRDLDAILDCEIEIGTHDHPHHVVTRDELVGGFERSYVDIATDTIVALGPTGVVLGWGIVAMPPEPETIVRSILGGGVRPSARGRGIGRQLLAWQQGRGMQQLASSDSTLPGWLIAVAPEAAHSAPRLFERRGLTIARTFLILRRELSQPIADSIADASVRVEAFTARWSAATHAAKDDAFRDHWGSQPGTDEQWNSFIGRSNARPELSFLAIGRDAHGTDEVAGFLLVSVDESNAHSGGYIELVGVTRAWRKRGIAAALMAASMRAMAAVGLREVVLEVDATNPSGALGLYRGLGFAPAGRSDWFTRVF